jgi:hypothetical protein
MQCEDLSDDELYELSVELSRTINEETDASAKLIDGHYVPGTRGFNLDLGTILLTLMSSGTAVALFNVLKAYFERRPSLKLHFETPEGGKFSIGVDNVSSEQTEKTLDLFEQFISGGK